MDNHCSPLLSWPYYNQSRSMEELRHSLLCTTLELESTKLAVQEELRKKEDELIQLKELLVKAIRERDEAQDKCQRLLIEKLILQQQQQKQHLTVTLPATTTHPLSGTSSIEDEPRKRVDSNNNLSSSDCEESIVSSPRDPIPQSSLPPPPSTTTTLSQQNIELVPDKPLPEKGKLLQAVMKAGPLLQTLLLAGPLPQWRHPPPPLETSEIPPVTIHSPPPATQTPASSIPPSLLLQDSLINITGNSSSSSGIGTNCGRVSRKRSLFEDSAYPTETKFQRVALH